MLNYVNHICLPFPCMRSWHNHLLLHSKKKQREHRQQVKNREGKSSVVTFTCTGVMQLFTVLQLRSYLDWGVYMSPSHHEIQCLCCHEYSRWQNIPVQCTPVVSHPQIEEPASKTVWNRRIHQPPPALWSEHQATPYTQDRMMVLTVSATAGLDRYLVSSRC